MLYWILKNIYKLRNKFCYCSNLLVLFYDKFAWRKIKILSYLLKVNFYYKVVCDFIILNYLKHNKIDLYFSGAFNQAIINSVEHGLQSIYHSFKENDYIIFDGEELFSAYFNDVLF